VTPAARATGFDVVLAGHLHGGQLVLFESGGRLYPYAWIDRWNGLRFDLPGTTLVVSRGVADALPLRVRCPREVVLCELY
jgi:predicted MPP superfamily phosphohydrolase